MSKNERDDCWAICWATFIFSTLIAAMVIVLTPIQITDKIPNRGYSSMVHKTSGQPVSPVEAR